MPPVVVEPIARHLGRAKMARDDPRHRIVVEKPFGRNLDSARRLNAALTRIFEEAQIYRIDHYLGKETVQNLLAFRFANSLFEPIWNRRYIDHVQITVAEDVGIGHRGDDYDRAGALRDMMQNHLSQVLCLIAMEPPVNYTADEIRNKKIEASWALITPVLEAWETITPADFPNYPAGTWGPEEAELLTAQDGHSWYSSTPQDEPDDQDVKPAASPHPGADRRRRRPPDA